MARTSKITITKSKNKNYLNEKDIEMIQNQIINIFGDEVNQKIKIDINNLKNRLDYIIQKVQLIRVESSSSKYYRIKRNSAEKKRLMAEAYLIIFKVREYLLNETINYRYYYNTDETARVIQFEEKNILNYIKFGREGLKIADNILKRQESNQQYQDLIDKHYNNLLNGIQKVPNASFHIVHSTIMEKYESSNPGLKRQTGKGVGRIYQVFTMGHIFEAMDIAFSEAIIKNQINNYDLIEHYMYGKYLNYDSIAGTKGGDNPLTMTQIKANVADLLDYNTLLKDLNIIKNIFSIDQQIDNQKIKENIKKLYIDASKYQDINDFNNAIDTALNQVLQIIT